MYIHVLPSVVARLALGFLQVKLVVVAVLVLELPLFRELLTATAALLLAGVTVIHFFLFLHELLFVIFSAEADDSVQRFQCFLIRFTFSVTLDVFLVLFLLIVEVIQVAVSSAPGGKSIGFNVQIV